MPLLQVLIVDDEVLARERLRGLLRRFPDVEVIGECANGSDALAVIQTAAPNLVFLDMQMPNGDGLKLIEELPARPRPAIVFATAHEQYAVNAFDVGAVDYLLKPFDRERLGLALQRVRDLFANRSGGEATSSSGEDASIPGQPRRLAIRTEGRIVFIRSTEIVWIEANDNHVALHLANGRLLLRDTLTALESRLEKGRFARVNRSAIVQLDQVKEIQTTPHGDYTIVLRNGTRVPLSRGFRGQFECLVK